MNITKVLKDDETDTSSSFQSHGNKCLSSALRKVLELMLIIRVGETLQWYQHNHRLHLQSTLVSIKSFLMFVSCNP